MKDLLGGLLGARKNNSASGISGLLLASGVPFEDAILQGATISNQQRQAEAHEQQVKAHIQEAMQRQQQQQQLQAKIQGLDSLLQRNPNLTDRDIAQYFAQSGMEAPNSLLKTFENNTQDKFNPVTGEIVRFKNGVTDGQNQNFAGGNPNLGNRNTPSNLYEDNPLDQGDTFTEDTGFKLDNNDFNSLLNNPIGQMKIGESKLGEETQTKKEFREGQQNVNAKADIAREQLDLLDDLEKQFEIYDKNVGAANEAGSLFGAVSPKTLQNTTLNKEARAAKINIEKIAGLLERAATGGKGAGSIPELEGIRSTIPTLAATPEARPDIFKTLRKQALQKDLSQEFTTQWGRYNSNSGELNRAFNDFIQKAPVFNAAGKINKELKKVIPQAVKLYLTGNEKGVEELLNNFQSDQLRKLAAEELKRRKGAK